MEVWILLDFSRLWLGGMGRSWGGIGLTEDTFENSGCCFCHFDE